MNKMLNIINEKLTLADELMQSGQLQESYIAIEDAEELLSEIKKKQIDENNLLLFKDCIRKLRRKLNNMMVKVVKADTVKKSTQNGLNNISSNQT